MSRLLRPLLLWLFVILGIWNPGLALARNALPEYLLKVGFLYHFAILTEWPPNTLGESFELCFIGNQEFGSALESIRGKAVNERRVNIRDISSADEAIQCNMLFIAELESTIPPRLIKEIAMKPVMTVTDDEKLAGEGITILMRPEGKRLVFEVDAEAAKKAKLNISSRLLRLSRK